MAAHLAACVPAHDGASGRPRQLLRFRVTVPDAAEYWLDVEAYADAGLALDAFLRGIWLECCGHLSMFSIPPFRYSSSASGTGLFGRRSTERDMRVRLGEAFRRDGQEATYDYDFGSTTRLTVERSGARAGRIGKEPVRLPARNAPPPWTWGVCGAPATLVCCVHEADNSSPFVCAAHEPDHECADAIFLPVVNSPRMGVCGYAG